MPPSRTVRRSKASPYLSMDKLDFEKQKQIFDIHGVECLRVTLLNGDRIVKGDCVEVDQGEDYSNTSYEGEHWFAEVLEIKGATKEAKNTEMYVRINWFYSKTSKSLMLAFLVFTESQNRTTDLKNFHCTVGNITRCLFSKNELVLSNHVQVIAADTLLRKVTIRYFNELDRDQDYIGNKELWYRFNLRVGNGPMDNRIVLGKNQTLPPARCAIEACTKRYKPDEDYQRLCARSTCGFWYHTQCLENVGFESVDRGMYKRRLQAMLTRTDQVLDFKDQFGNELDEVPEYMYEWLVENVEKGRNGIECEFPDNYPKGFLWNVIWCAETPITRGKEFGITGNEEIVREARVLVRDMFNERGSGLWPPDEQVERFAAYNREPEKRLFSCVRCGLAV